MPLKAFFRELQAEKFSGIDAPKIVAAPHCKGGEAIHFEPDLWVRFRLFFQRNNIREAQRDDHARGAERYHVMHYSEIPLGVRLLNGPGLDRVAEDMDAALSQMQGGKLVSGEGRKLLIEPGLPWYERTPNGIAGIRYRDSYTVSESQLRKYFAFQKLRSAEPTDVWRIHELAEKHGVLIDLMPRLLKDERGKERLVISVEPVESPVSK